MGRPRLRDDCARCGKPLTGQASKYCSPGCWHSTMRTRVDVQCQVCGKVASVKKFEVADGGRKFCSHKCYAESMKRPDLHFPCVICGELYYRSPADIALKSEACSIKCRSKHRMRKVKVPPEKDFRDWMIRRNLITQCNRCGYNEHKLILVIHHRDRNRKNSDI